MTNRMNAGTATIVSSDPVTGTPIGTFPITGRPGVAEAVARAREAARWWEALGHHARRTRLLAWKRLMARRFDEIADLIVRENGKVHADAAVELAAAWRHLDWAARHAGRVLRSRRRFDPLAFPQVCRVDHRPLGVVGVIASYNYPVLVPLSAATHALAGGNAVVIKPSEHTPACALWLADTFREAVGGPAVFQVLTGDATTGEALCRSGVDKIAFIGSSSRGPQILAACATTLTPTVLELGGKDAMVVAADADIEAAADAALWAGCTNAGQTCLGIERVYVAEPVFAAFLHALIHRARTIKAGRHYGAMTEPAQLDTIRRHINDALNRGATAALGGPASVRPPYVDPVILTHVPEDAAVQREETFGPLLVVNPVRDTLHGIDLANHNDYQLGAALFTRQGHRRLASAFHAGSVSVNDTLGFMTVGSLPYGGRGASGFGRLHGPEGLLEFTATRAAARRVLPTPFPFQTYDRTSADIKRLNRLTRLLGRL